VELDADRGDAGVVVVVALAQPAGVDGHGVGQDERADPENGRHVDVGVAGGDDLGGGVDAPQPGLQGADVFLVHEADPTSGTHFHTYVALHPSRPGQARQVMRGLLGWNPYLKTWWPSDGLPGSPLDPSSTADGTTSRTALDDTRGPGFDGVRITVAEDSRRTARRLLGDGAG
jgi:hypothetical protein